MRGLRSGRRLALAALLCLLGACSEEDEKLTAIVVAVDSNIEGLDSVTVDIENFGDQPLVSAELSDAGDGQLPKHVGLVHRGGPLGPITITAEGARNGTVEVIKRRSRVFFVRDKTMLLRLNLLKECINNDCEGDEEKTCSDRGICESIDARASDLTEWHGEIPPLVIDIGGDGGTDGGTPDDAGIDAGSLNDAGVDAGVDSGPVPQECTYPAASCDMEDGCETNLQTSLDHCGACDGECTVTNGTAECVAGTCTLDSCTSPWADCNGGLDCERDTTPPGPNETGGQGPCLPDTNCTLEHNAATGHDYYFCGTSRSYADARTQCQSQRFGDLVRIDDVDENTFVQDHLGMASWVGASDDPNEGAWRWSTDTLQFWSGDGSGVAVDGLYSNWMSGEPLTSGNCAQMLGPGATAGSWQADDCAQTKPFVCEVQADACPGDPTKQSPMQCGCGTPDLHDDADGVANCDEDCDTDPDKLVPGICGCGAVEVLDDTDGDGTKDCVDECPTDASKAVAADNVCGCGLPETDTTAPCAYSFTPSNFNPVGIFAGASDVTCTMPVSPTTQMFDTSAGTPVTVCGTLVTPVIQPQANGGPDVWILPMNSLTVPANLTLRFVGTRPVVLAIATNAIINGTLDVSAQTTTPGAGGNVSCGAGTGQGGDGGFSSGNNEGDGGGGGAGFRTLGTLGGSGNAAPAATAGTAGAMGSDLDLSPLRGGCRGGAVAVGGNVNSAGAGGGAIELAVAGTLTLGASAIVAAAGGGGLKGPTHEDGGGGGGSGGGIFVEAKVLSIHADAWITSNGGGGAGGNATNTTNGTNGANGPMASTARAAGGNGGDSSSSDSDGGNGGLGAALAGPATAGSNGTTRTCPLTCGLAGGGGGGGGGSAGLIRIHGLTAGCSVPTVRVSPAASTACP